MTTAARRPKTKTYPDRTGPTLLTPEARTQLDFLEVRKLTVEFDGFVAVDNVDLTVMQGDLRFLIGPNGAGKTTLIDAITGLVPAHGTAYFNDHKLLNHKVHHIARAGVGRTFQTATVIEELSVLSNLDIAAGADRKLPTLFRSRGQHIPEAVESALEMIGLANEINTPAGVLAHGQKQWLEIGMLLVQNARLLLLDEPVAGMSHKEREHTAELLRKLVEQRTVIVVEHDMDFMRSVADSVTVLASGSVLAEGSVDDIQQNPTVQEIYLGTPNTEGGR